MKFITDSANKLATKVSLSASIGWAVYDKSTLSPSPDKCRVLTAVTV